MKGLIGFIAGLGIGGVATWLLTKEYYRRLADEEIKSVVERDRFRREEDRREEQHEEKEEERNEREEKKIYSDLITKNYAKPSVTEYAAKYVQHDTVDDYSYEETEHPEDDDEDGPHIISSEEFIEEEDYDKITFTYYADGYVVEGEGAYAHVIDNVDDVLGPEALDSFGDDPTDPDVVYVRNDSLQTDYEVLKSLDNYLE